MEKPVSEFEFESVRRCDCFRAWEAVIRRRYLQAVSMKKKERERERERRETEADLSRRHQWRDTGGLSIGSTSQTTGRRGCL